MAYRKTGVSAAATAGLKSIESTPSSSSGSLDLLDFRARLQNSSLMPIPKPPKSTNDLSNPIYMCASVPESRAKTLCRKQPGRMLELTETQVSARA